MNPSRILLITLVCLIFTLSITQSFGKPAKKKFSDRELEEIEDQWFEDEEVGDNDLDHWKKSEDGARRPPKPEFKTEMVFVGLKSDLDWDQDSTSEWAGRQSDILNSGGVPIKAYPVEAGRALFVIERGVKDVQQVKEFLLDQPETADFEWNQKKSYPKSSKSKKSKKSTKKSKKPAQSVDEDEDRIEAIRQALANGESVEKIKQINEQVGKRKLVDESLGGAGGSIPAEFPDEL